MYINAPKFQTRTASIKTHNPTTINYSWFQTFCCVLNVVCFLLGKTPVFEFYMPTFRNTLSVPPSYVGRYLPAYEDTESIIQQQINLTQHIHWNSTAASSSYLRLSPFWVLRFSFLSCCSCFCFSLWGNKITVTPSYLRCEVFIVGNVKSWSSGMQHCVVWKRFNTVSCHVKWGS